MWSVEDVAKSMAKEIIEQAALLKSIEKEISRQSAKLNKVDSVLYPKLNSNFNFLKSLRNSIKGLFSFWNKKETKILMEGGNVPDKDIYECDKCCVLEQRKKELEGIHKFAAILKILQTKWLKMASTGNNVRRRKFLWYRFK